jgi:hypothetical protein
MLPAIGVVGTSSCESSNSTTTSDTSRSAAIVKKNEMKNQDKVIEEINEIIIPETDYEHSVVAHAAYDASSSSCTYCGDF